MKTYLAQLTDEWDGILAISLVDNPAVETPVFCFEKDMQVFTTPAEQMITGVIMLADTPILRRDNEGNLYNIVFSKEVLKEMAQKMLEEGTFKNINFQHNGIPVDGIHLVELYQKDTEKGIDPIYWINAPEGSLFGTFKVDDLDTWNIIKENTLGYSIECRYDVVETFNKNQNNNHSFMKKFKEIVKSVVYTFNSVMTDKAVLVWGGDEDLKAGDEVYIEGENGESNKVEDGDYVTEDGKTIVVVDSKVAEIKDPVAEVAPEVPEDMACEDDKKKMEETVIDEVKEEIKEETVEEPKEDIVSDIVKSIISIEEKIGNLESKLAELEVKLAEPAAEPIVEEYKSVISTIKGSSVLADICKHVND